MIDNLVSLTYSKTKVSILLRLRDSDTSTREAAVKYFNVVGEKYLEENDESLHEELHYDVLPPSYPPNYRKFSLL